MVEFWGVSEDGHDIERVTIANGGLTASIITMGAALQDLRLEGHDHSLVLGFDTCFDYGEQTAFVGAVAGRFAARISGGRFDIDGREFNVDRNEGNNTLHGGSVGFDKCIWSIMATGEDFVTLELRSPDGDMGFPGEVIADCRYRLTLDACLEVILRARTNKPTICAMTHHGYFNLSDGGAGTINGHRLMIDAEQYLSIDSFDIPDGELLDVAGKDTDFRQERIVGSTMLDNNFCLSNERVPLRPVARLVGETGICMDVATTEPGMQVYTADFMGRVPARKSGLQYGFRSGICLETQVWPDAPNHSHFPSARLNPGEQLVQHTTFTFSRRDA